MFHTLFLAPLAAPLLGSPPLEVPLTAALPADTVAAVHIPNPRRLVAKRDTNNWVAFAMDAEWNRFLGAFMQDLHDTIDPKEVPAWREAVMGVAKDTSSVIFFVSGNIENGGDPPTVGLIARGGETTGTHLRRFIGADAKPTSIGEGRTALISHAGRAEFFYESAGLYLLMSTPEVEGSISAATDCLRALDAGEPGGPFAIPDLRALRSDEASIEIAVSLDRVWSGMDEFDETTGLLERSAIEAASSIRWILMTGELGNEEDAEWNVLMPYGEDSLLGGMLDFMGEADRTLLERVPAGAVSATVGKFDTKGFSDWVLKTLEDTSEEMHAQAEGALNGLRDLVGIDFMGDIIANMNGDFLGFSSAPKANSEELMSMIGGMNLMTFVAGFNDPDPMIDVVEMVVDMSGMGAAISSETAAIAGSENEIEVWRTTDPEAVGGIDGTIAVGAGELLVSTDASAAAAYLAGRTGSDALPMMLADDALKAAVKSANGSIVSIQPTSAAADALEGMADMFDMLMPVFDEEGNRPMSSGDAMRGVADLFRQYFEGTTTTTMHAKAGLIRIRSLSR